MTDPTAAPADRPRATVRILAAVAAGGVIGAWARHGLSTAWPAAAGGFPWATFVVNVSGCFALGALMAWVLGRRGGGETHPLLQPFLGTGVLGGYTTFSAYAVEADGLLRDGHDLMALGYLAGSVVVGLVAAWVGFGFGRGRRFVAPPSSRDRHSAGEGGGGG